MAVSTEPDAGTILWSVEVHEKDRQGNAECGMKDQQLNDQHHVGICQSAVVDKRTQFEAGWVEEDLSAQALFADRERTAQQENGWPAFAPATREVAHQCDPTAIEGNLV